ncbi:TIGR00730 family Rossman fold protein [Aliidiomarina sedimenti]|uniref:Cytokinin riboside 5'-monophosphate phosphoribohydrolase n=1 Tax=Aliidiomarina sedimenti TaxID=1933879 RepID=A0ABY0C2P1_9GAMM|nr:TIGR00730 family Rossman fold protein [Aliidiomarina sedimenti]RUO31918.1 TIGR00730 family Rossman fold protein [Aliidiomarina sedimenti]
MKSICIYCGSNPGRGAVYAGAARELARELVNRDLKLVYGGASVGIMGLIADTVLELGGEAVGVIPEALVRKEVAHANLTELFVTQSMHERKTLMSELSDGFIAMPGGIGTLEEIFEVWTWAQLGFHGKPCGLLNVDGYFDSLIAFLDNAVAEQFVQQPHRDMLIVDAVADTLLDRFASYEAPTIVKWIEKGER